MLLHGGPWFLRRPRQALLVAVVLFAAICALRFAAGPVADDVSLLYTFPIALLAVTYGLRGGLLAGLVGSGLLALWVAVDGVSISPLGWFARLAPMLLLGYLLGDAMDRLQRAEAERRRLEAAARRQRDAIEINDTIVQGLSAAKWALESTDLDGGLRIVTDTLDLGQRLVSDLIREADLAPIWSGESGAAGTNGTAGARPA